MKFFPNLFSFAWNLSSIAWRVPQAIVIIKAIMDIVGSAQVQKLLEAIRDALKQETPNPAVPPSTEPERERLVKRLFRRLALTNLGMSEQQYASFCNQPQGRNQA